MLLDVRTYRCRPGTLAAHLKLYETRGKEAQTRHLGQPVAFLLTETGDPNEYIHIWAYENAGDREARALLAVPVGVPEPVIEGDPGRRGDAVRPRACALRVGLHPAFVSPQHRGKRVPRRRVVVFVGHRPFLCARVCDSAGRSADWLRQRWQNHVEGAVSPTLIAQRARLITRPVVALDAAAVAAAVE